MSPKETPTKKAAAADARVESPPADGGGASSADVERAWLAAIVDSSEDAIVSKTLEGVITSFNAAAERLYGYRPEEVIGKHISTIVPEDLHPQLREIDASLRRGEKVSHLETVRLRKDGTRVEVAVSISPVRDSSGRTVGAANIARDITARRRSEAELVAAIETVMADASWFSRSIVEKLAALRQPQQPGQSPVRAAVADLTRREREVLALVCQGRSDAEIATELRLARTTARNHVVSLYRKLGVNRRSALVVWARERGIGGDGVPPKRPKGRKRGSSEPA